METPADRVWQRITQTARVLAMQKSLPSARHAEAIVSQILREEAVEPPPARTVAELAQELLRGIADAA